MDNTNDSLGSQGQPKTVTTSQTEEINVVMDLNDLTTETAQVVIARANEQVIPAVETDEGLVKGKDPEKEIFIGHTARPPFEEGASVELTRDEVQNLINQGQVNVAPDGYYLTNGQKINVIG